VEEKFSERHSYMAEQSTQLVQKLWNYCNILRDDGLSYGDYVEQLTFLLFLKMASEQKDESRIPKQYRWVALKSASETEVLQRYRQALIDLGDGIVDGCPHGCLYRSGLVHGWRVG